MYSKVICGTTYGVEGILVQVEVDVSDGLPCCNMVGYLASEVREAGERVRTALRNAGYFLPPKRITVNLSPADIRKEGSGFDLAISIAMLAAMGYIPQDKIENLLIIGELGLDGTVHRISGILPIVDYAMKQNISACVVPYDNVKEASYIQKIDTIGIHSLQELVSYLNGDISIQPHKTSGILKEKIKDAKEDFSDIKGQGALKRAMEIAVAGMHNIIIVGPPGAGKSMIAKRIPTIMPLMSFEESIDITKIYSVKAMLDNEQLIMQRPFRAPHHTISPSAMIGGGKTPKPGEISLAHKGVLFLDELPEFNKNVIEVLRQPLEDRQVLISRVNGSYCFPADFMLVAAMNACPCGAFPDLMKCSCTPEQVAKYRARVSQAILDRIDLNVEVSAVCFDDMCGNSSVIEEKSVQIRDRIESAHQIQRKRYQKLHVRFNSQLNNKEIETYCVLGKEQQKLMQKAFHTYHFSARAYHRILRVARTIADLEKSKEIQVSHIIEAIGYRTFDSVE